MHGGKRKGAGRKPALYKKEPLGIRLHPIVKAALQKIPGYNAWLQRLICKELGINLKEQSK